MDKIFDNSKAVKPGDRTSYNKEDIIDIIAKY